MRSHWPTAISTEPPCTQLTPSSANEHVENADTRGAEIAQNEPLPIDPLENAAGRVILEQKVTTEPADIITLLTSLGVSFCRIGIEAGPLSQWLVNALTAADLPVICVETRHMKALLTAQQINKTDRNDARGIAQMMRVGLFKPVHVKT